MGKILSVLIALSSTMIYVACGEGGAGLSGVPAEGLALFEAKCAECHSSVEEFSGLSFESIEDALDDKDHKDVEVTDEELEILRDIVSSLENSSISSADQEEDDGKGKKGKKKKGKGKKDKDKKGK